MIWPPLKAWTSKVNIYGHRHFVAINYGGKLQGRWVDLVSVIDGKILIKVNWSELQDKSRWNYGWDENNCLDFLDSSDKNYNQKTIEISSCSYPSLDSGLTIPITNKKIRPWFTDH